MKKIFTLLFAASFSVAALAQKATLSPNTKSYLADAGELKNNQRFPSGYVYKKRNDGKICVSAIVKVNNAAVVQDGLEKLGITVGTKAGNIWTTQIPIENVKAFVQLSGIAYIQIDEPVAPSLDVARKTMNVDSAHAGYALPTGYSGKGVLMGVIDFGFDYNHPSMYDTSGNKYRIVKAWEMNTTGTPPAGYSYGHEISDTTLLKAQGTDNKDQTHGAGVAGLASGSGYGSPTPGRFKGVAYESDMVFVGVRRDSIEGQWLSGGFSDFIDGVSYLTKYATSVGKPMVINISWGSHSGPHDGSSLVNQAFDTLSGAGKIIVMSAGNEGSNNLHLGKTFTALDSNLLTFLSFSSNAYKRTWVDIWGDTAKTFCVTTSLYSKGIKGNTTGRICIDNSTKINMLISANGLDTCFVKTYTSAAEYNMKPRVTIDIYNKATDSVGIQVNGTSGKINMWDEYYYYGYTYRYSSAFTNFSFPSASIGNTATTVSDMGAGKSVLLVGAYTSKSNFTDINGIPRTYGAGVGFITSFSSKGPYVDGRIKPDITAPGLTIATSVNSWDTAYTETGSSSSNVISKFTHPVSSKDYYYAEFAGTSASSPLAAGVVALLLQADPTLTPDRVKEIIFETAIKDAFTGSIPTVGNNNWGHGKINAYSALRKLQKDLSVVSFEGKKSLDCVLYPNPNNGDFTIDLMSQNNETMQVRMFDISGKMISNQDWKLTIGTNKLPLSLSEAAKGLYFISVSGTGASIQLKAQVK